MRTEEDRGGRKGGRGREAWGGREGRGEEDRGGRKGERGRGGGRPGRQRRKE